VARVVLTGALRRFAGGASELEIGASDVRALVRALEERFPGIAVHIEDNMSIAIDGDIIQDPLLEPIGPESEVHFLPQLQGG
jgi:molybdopterin converting factor small subunit